MISLKTPVGVSLRRSGKLVFIQQGEHSVGIALRSFRMILTDFTEYDWANIQPVFVGNDCLLLGFNEHSTDVRLGSFKVNSGAINWAAELWGTGGRALNGRMTQFATTIVDGKRAFVYGATTFGAYVEAFSLDQGRPLVRFATDYGTGEGR